MPTSSFSKFNSFVENLCEGVFEFGSDTLKVYLTNATPNAAADVFKADLAEITMTNETNHGAGGADTQASPSYVSGVASIVGVDPNPFVASGGSVGPFRYAVLYDDTATSPDDDPLIGWWDYGSNLTLGAGEELELDFGSSMFTVT